MTLPEFPEGATVRQRATGVEQTVVRRMPPNTAPGHEDEEVEPVYELDDGSLAPHSALEHLGSPGGEVMTPAEEAAAAPAEKPEEESATEDKGEKGEKGESGEAAAAAYPGGTYPVLIHHEDGGMVSGSEQPFSPPSEAVAGASSESLTGDASSADSTEEASESPATETSESLTGESGGEPQQQPSQQPQQ